MYMGIGPTERKWLSLRPDPFEDADLQRRVPALATPS